MTKPSNESAYRKRVLLLATVNEQNVDDEAYDATGHRGPVLRKNSTRGKHDSSNDAQDGQDEGSSFEAAAAAAWVNSAGHFSVCLSSSFSGVNSCRTDGSNESLHFILTSRFDDYERYLCLHDKLGGMSLVDVRLSWHLKRVKKQFRGYLSYDVLAAGTYLSTY